MCSAHRSGAAASRRLRVVQVSFHADAQRRGAEALLCAWPTLAAVASAAAATEVDVTVVQAAHRNERIARDGVRYHFVDDTSRTRERVIACVASQAPDVVHVHGLGFPRPMRPLRRALPGVPQLVQDHGAVVPTGWRVPAWRWAYGTIDGVAFTAREQAVPWFQEKILRAGVPVFEVLEGSTTFVPGDRHDARREMGCRTGPRHPEPRG